MTGSTPFIMYSRPGCHLCERVAEMLVQLGADWRLVDIEGDAGLESLYGLQIPVVENRQTKKRLFFPFGEEQLKRFLEGGIDSET